MDPESMSDFELLLEAFRVQTIEIERLRKLNELFDRKAKLLEKLLELERKERQNNEENGFV